MSRADVEARISANAAGYKAAMDEIRRLTKKTSDASSGDIGRLGKRFAAMESDVVRSTSRINRALSASGATLLNYGKTFAAGLAGGIAAGGVAGIVTQIADVAQGIAAVGDEAKRAGLSVQAFQELKFVAEQNRIGVDSLVDGIKELNLRADEFIATGAGSAAEAFGRLGYDAQTLAQKLKNPSDLFAEIIGKLAQLDRAAQIRIADEIFGGTGGEKFVQLVERGEQGIRDQIKAARELGLVWDEQLIKKADELDQKFRVITSTVGNGLKAAIVEASSALIQFINEFQRLYDERRSAAEAGTYIGSLAGTPYTPGGTTKAAPKGDRLPQFVPTPPAPTNSELAADYLKAYRAELALTNREQSIAAETQRILSDANSRGIKVTKEQASALAAEKVARDEADAAAKKAESTRERLATRTEAERKAVKELIAELEEELSLVGASEQAKRAAAAAREAGAAATDAERARIVALNEAIYQGEEAERKRAEAMEFVGDIALDGVNALTQAIDTGNEALDQFLATLIQAVAQAALLGQGPLAGLFGGGILSGLGGGGFNPTAGGFRDMIGYAKGTNSARRGFAWVGEDGPEIVDFGGGERVIPNHDIARAMSFDVARPDMDRYQQNSSTVFSPTLNISAPNAQPGVSAEIEAAGKAIIEQIRKEFPANTVKALQVIKLRGMNQ